MKKKQMSHAKYLAILYIFLAWLIIPGTCILLAAEQTSKPATSGSIIPPPQPQFYVLSVDSYPFQDVAISCSPNDDNGDGDGSTLFTRNYLVDSQATLTAPASVIHPSTEVSYGFTKWVVNGYTYTNRIIKVTMDDNYTATAYFVPIDPNNQPVISISRSDLRFGYMMGGSMPSSQSILVDNVGVDDLEWYAETDSDWISFTPTEADGSGKLSISVDPSGMVSGTYSGMVALIDANATYSFRVCKVYVSVYNNKETTAPMGSVDTPTHGSTVYGSVPFTGWVLDDIETTRVQLYLDDNDKKQYIGDAVFVEGARPDVEANYNTTPWSYRAGWGYMLMTHFLPGKGNGTYRIHVMATDLENNVTELGYKTITVNNAGATLPFGAIDTPEQGGEASGKYLNWGWVLTPQPNYIPYDGSTLYVWVDGVKVGSPRYNIYRSDIATLLPGYANSNGAVGYLYLDTTMYENGVHTIQWTATDSAGNTDGIGSRYFGINNTTYQRSASSAAHARASTSRLEGIPGIKDIPAITHVPLVVSRGFDEHKTGEPVLAGETGTFHITSKEMERVLIQFPAGYTVLKADSLPVGSTLLENKFYWQPGLAYTGRHHLVFLLQAADGGIFKQCVTVDIKSKF